MADFEGNETILVAAVDCVAAGKSLCQQAFIMGYPTIRFGDPMDLRKYGGTDGGGRSFEELKKVADGLGPLCRPANLERCDDAQKKQIAEFQAMPASEREKTIAEKEGAIRKLQSASAKVQNEITNLYKETSKQKDPQAWIDGLQQRMHDVEQSRNRDVNEIRDSGLGILKSIHAEAKRSLGEL